MLSTTLNTASITMLTLFPLDAAGAIEALFDGPLGTVLQVIILVLVIALLFGALVAAAAAGLAQLSQDSGRQAGASRWAIASGVCLIAAGAVVVGPEVIAELGFDAARHLSILG